MIESLGKKVQLYTVVFALLAINAGSSPARASDRQMVYFQPVNVSLICRPDTPSASRLIYQRAAVSDPSVSPTECVDKQNSINNIYPDKVELVYRRDFGMWSVVIFVNKNDLNALKKISSGWVGKKILIGVNEKVISTAILNGPLNEQKVYISVDSEKFGNELLPLFVKPNS